MAATGDAGHRPVRAAFEASVAEAKARLAGGEYAAAWPALERAHVLGQRDPWLHVRSHWWMLRCGAAERDAREVIGQVVRAALAVPSSLLGRYPTGNTGRVRVGLFRPMPVSPEIADLLSSGRG
jgi:hypothetical protein